MNEKHAALAEILQKVPLELLYAEIDRRSSPEETVIRRIIVACAEAWEIDARKIYELGTRSGHGVIARHAAMRIMHDHGMGAEQIGAAFGSDSSTVRHAVRTHYLKMQDPDFAARMARAREIAEKG